MKAATLKDIANETGVSTTTVSIILNNRADHISEKTKQRVTEVAERLNYRPNKVAQSLVKHSSNSIGLILPDIANPFFAEIAKGVTEEAIKCNYTVSIFNTDDDINKDIKYIEYMLDIYVDGFIAILSTDAQTGKIETCAELLRKINSPIVLIDRLLDGENFLSVETDNKLGAFLAVEHLINCGHNKIGCVSSPLNTNISKQRFYGYLEALQKHEIKFDSNLVYEGPFRFSTGYKGAYDLVAKGVTAIFAFNDLMAYGVYKGLEEQGIKIPQNVSVVGYDDLMYSSMLSTPLTTIRQPALEIGKSAAQKLINALSENPLPQNRKTIFKPELIIRESTACK